MIKGFKSIAGDAAAWWVDGVRRFPLWILLIALGITGLLAHYTVNNLGMNTDTSDMLSERLHFRRLEAVYNEAFSREIETILVVVDGQTPGLALDATKRLADQLRRDTKHFRTVYVPGGGPYFAKSGLLFLSTPELEDLADNLARVQPFLARLTRDPSLQGLFSMLTMALEAAGRGEEISLGPLLDRLAKSMDAVLNHGFQPLSWGELMGGRPPRPYELRRFIVIEPRVDYTRWTAGEGAVETIRRIVRESLLNPENGVQVHITGEVALKYEEMKSVSRGVGITLIFALATVCMVLLTGLRSVKLVAGTLVTLVMGLTWTAGFAAVSVGHLNLLSIAFAVLYIGLGVDYAIHFCLRYRELIAGGQSHAPALRQTARDIGSSLVLCAFTTAIGFYAFIPTVFKGVAELGLIAGTGMFIGLVANLTVLPAWLCLLPLSPSSIPRGTGPGRLSDLIFSFPVRHKTVIRLAALALGIGSLFLLPFVTFDANTMNLKDPEAESVATFNELLGQSWASPWSLVVLAPNKAAAVELKKRVRDMKVVDRAVLLDDFIPGGQEEKLAIIEDLSLIMGPELPAEGSTPAPKPAEQRAALRDLGEALRSYVRDRGAQRAGSEEAVRLLAVVDAWESALAKEDEETQAHRIAGLEKAILGTLPGRLAAFRASLEADRVTADDLPEDLLIRWVSGDGRYRVEIFPAEDLNDEDALRRFVGDVQQVTPDAFGYPMILLEAGDAVVGAFQQAFVSALIAITLLLLILMGRKRDAFLVVAPLLLAGALTGAASVLFHLPFNFANIIALPLILGIGVDNGIHMVHRIRTAPPRNGKLLQTSTARAVLFSALTTICSFGNLALSPHRGTASMGLMLTIGVGFTLICTLVLLPAMAVRKEI